MPAGQKSGLSHLQRFPFWLRHIIACRHGMLCAAEMQSLAVKGEKMGAGNLLGSWQENQQLNKRRE